MLLQLDSTQEKLFALSFLLRSSTGSLPGGASYFVPVLTPFTLRSGNVFTVTQDNQALFSETITIEADANITLELGAVLKEVS